MAEIKHKQRGALNPVSYKTRTSPAGASFRRHRSMACSVGTSLCSISAYNCKYKMLHISFLSYRVARIWQMQTTLSWMENRKKRFMHSPVLLRITSLPHHKHGWSDIQRWLTRHTKMTSWTKMTYQAHRWLTMHTKMTDHAHKDDWPGTQRWLTRHKNDKLVTQRCQTRLTEDD